MGRIQSVRERVVRLKPPFRACRGHARLTEPDSDSGEVQEVFPGTDGVGASDDPVRKVTRMPAHLPGKSLLFCLALLWAPSGNTDPPIIDVQAISGTAETDVVRLLGKPIHCAETYQGSACQYADGIEVVFIDGRADWIQFAPEVEIPFEPAALRHIGLLPAMPTVRNPFRMHWDGHQGLALVSVYGSGRYVALYQVHSFTTW